MSVRHFRDTIAIETDHRETYVNITDRVESAVNESKIHHGFVSVFPLHTSSAVFVNDSDPHLLEDIRDLLERLVPETIEYEHNRSDPKQNATAHLKSILTGHHVTLPISNGELDSGRFNTIYYAEFDGKRPKKILVKVLGTHPE